MRAKWTALGTSALSTLALVATAVAHHGPVETTIDAAADKKPGVVFPHQKHTELVESCATCHHTQEDLTAGPDAEVSPCSACHLDPEDAAVPSMREMSLKKNPLHVACIDCHKGQAKGPTKCADCHTDS